MRVLLICVVLLQACGGGPAETYATLRDAPLDLRGCPDSHVARVGGADVAPVILERVAAVWPKDSPRGAIIVEAVIARNGAVCAARVLRGLAPAADAEALRAVRQWRFRPAKKNGKPVQAAYALTLSTTTPARDESSPFSAASGVSRASDTAGEKARIVPLHKMSGDVEILSGDPEKEGEPFVMRIRELPGTRVPVHAHPVDENITVVQGTWYFAIGETWDEKALQPLRAGDYALAPKGSRMFAWCPDGAIVQVHGIGPFRIHWKHGARTLDDGAPASPFTFHKGEHVRGARGRGVIRHGYASGDIIQYEIVHDDESVVMEDQSALHRSTS